MRIDRCTDPKIINSIISHPRIYPHVSDDHSPKAEDFDCSEALRTDGVYFLTPIDGEVLGCFIVHLHTMTLFEVHTCLLPCCWGKKALEATALCAKWVFGNTTCQKLMTWVPTYNKLAYRLAIRSGMQDEGLCKKSYLKNGVLLDMHLLGLEK